MVEGEGFEPSYAMRPDLQSGAFNHSATPPQPKEFLDDLGFLRRGHQVGFWPLLVNVESNL